MHSMDDRQIFEEQRERIDKALSTVVDDMDRQHLRKLQLDMHKCASTCCLDVEASAENVQRCVDRCHLPLVRARNYVQQELCDFQTRLQRCVLSCNDDVKMQMRLQETGEQRQNMAVQFERCAVDCVDKHVGLLPTMMRAMKVVLEKNNSASSNS
ncbi:protein FAM136A [Scaptodrosophila lebanonensis]|uniref:Protein FAM136A n=1 Tax=Drosophila lebanonensis TaxID=7225 RepID=A0A6J2UH33_DROLE|nr:protein FAM136A [Scaptodrosophila lebanonensis]